MSSNVVNQVAYLRTTRNFPEDLPQLTVEINKSYVDIANAVNNRTISIFPSNRPAITGESFFISQARRQQTLRQVYPFDAIASGATLTIPHGINDFVQFTRMYGTCITDIPDYRPIPYVPTVQPNYIVLRADDTDIIIVNGTGPNIVSGIIILEWLSAV